MKTLLRMIMTLTLVTIARGSGVGKAWDVSPSLQFNSHRLSWPRSDTSPLEIRTISGVGRLPQQFKADFGSKISESKDLDSHNQQKNGRQEILQDDEIEFGRKQRELKPILNSLDFSEFEEILPAEDNLQFDTYGEIEHRVRRDADDTMEKISGAKNVREPRLSSPESWSKQPISVEFRHRTPLDQVIPDEENIPVSSRRSHVPQTDFITSNRRFFAESRESREMPVAKTYDDYDVPIYNSPGFEYDVPIARGYYYPNRYRTERDYRYRGSQVPSYMYDQYPAYNFESYDRNRPVPKQKRIIYYATLPEIVRQPDLGNYPRPYDGPTRVPPVSRNSGAGRKHIQDTVEPNRRPYVRYPYDYYDYDGYKRPGFYDRSVPYNSNNKEGGRRNSSHDRDMVPVHKENLRRDDDSNDKSQERKPRDNHDLPWPIQIGTEVSVKENERIPGRKIFGQLESYDSYESARMKKTPKESDGAVELNN